MYNIITAGAGFKCPITSLRVRAGEVCLEDSEGNLLNCSQLPSRKLTPLKDLLKTGYIELVSESGYKKPIQAYSKVLINGNLVEHHFFSEWDTFEEAIKWLRHAHKQPIVINRQSKIGI